MIQAEDNRERVQVIRPSEDLPCAVAQLLSSHERGCIEVGAGWWKVFCVSVIGDERGARLLVRWRDGSPVAAMAVCVSEPPGFTGGMRGALSNYYTSLYAPLLAPQADRNDLKALVNELRTQSRNAWRFRFAPMDSESLGFDWLRSALEDAGFLTHCYQSHVNWYLPVEADWNAYLGQRPGALRSTIHRKVRALLGAGARFQIVLDEVEVDTALAAYMQVYEKSWKRPEPCPDFIPGFARMCAAQGWLRLGVIWLGDEPIAAQIWTVAHGKASIYKLAYDERFKRFAPGTVLTAHLMRHVIDVDRVAEVDFLIGDDAYKALWMTERRVRVGLVADNLRSLRGMLGGLGLAALRPLHSLRWRPRATPDVRTDEQAQKATQK